MYSKICTEAGFNSLIASETELITSEFTESIKHNLL